MKLDAALGSPETWLWLRLQVVSMFSQAALGLNPTSAAIGNAECSGLENIAEPKQFESADKMFQTPVNNLEKIRKARKRVKQLLLQIGLETCKDSLEGYRSKQYCCSLCKFSTRLLSSFKAHLQRYHEDEKDQELMSACPSCPYTSQTKNVVKHMRIFHSSIRKVPPGKESPSTVNSVRFSCAKCNFTDTLYYSLKRHVLLTHHQAELENYFGEKSEEELKRSSVFKICPDSRWYCKKCNCITSNRDALMYHILTSDKHRDLEVKLRYDITDVSRTNVKRPYKKFLSSSLAHPPKPPLLLPNVAAVVSPTKQDVKVHSLQQNGPNTPLLGTPNPSIQKIAPASTVSNPATGLGQKISTTLAPSAQVGFVTAQLPQNQSITLQASLPQSVFLSPRFPLNQPVTATVLPSGGQVIPGTQAGVRSAVLPMNQTLALNQQAVLTCPQALQSAVINVNPAVRPNNVAGNQPAIAPNTILTAPILRQLIPTGKQVNGIPTYTLAPISVTLPVAPCAIPAVTPPKVPVQLSQPDKVVQVSTSPASAPSPPVVQVPQTASQKPTNSTAAKGQVIAPARGKEAKQWKTCPVCSELFPPNVYEVHMQIAHIKQENSPNKPIDSSATNEAKETVVVAAQASFLKVLKERSIRCLTCKTFTQEGEVLKHLLMHGMVCLYCKAVFHELRNFIYHMKILHVGKKKVHGDFVKKGITISSDANGDALFPYFDFTFNVSREEIGDKDMHLAVVTGANANTASPVYIKIQYRPESYGSGGQQASNCPFCNCALSEPYETHLKEKHHIMPTVHTILKTPAFKCIHCCGVYTGSMTLSAISVHLQRCRNAPKDSTSGAELVSENNGKHKGGEYVKIKQNTAADAQGASSESKNNYRSGPYASKEPPSKRRRLDMKPDSSESLETLESLDMLEMIPDSSATVSHESKKEFLSKYFHKKPYPSKREIELLSVVLEMWKSDVASFFGTKRYMCLKFLKNHKQRVLLGFKMAELKIVQHDIELQEDY
ncbi:activity-dependent neuroprotector homeobox protein 2 isoform X2 [Dendropsophus ebraccatus]|uniref:activity-dependent neuroprotector homeobox protein 2 isoform X2 n=1 Tax=Dendropsophus ebraccatus TaxID=150705 RepID=UPI0038317469